MATSPEPDWLGELFKLAPQEAIAFLEAKGLRITWDWREMLDEAHARAFTVAKAMRLDVLRDIRTGLIDALNEGKTLRQFQDDLQPLLEAKGWWGKKEVIGPDGQAQEVQLGSPRRLKTIYQTNLHAAYMAGRAQVQFAGRVFEFMQYVAVMDGRTRPSHAALDGKVWRRDDPVWAAIYPPNGSNCRCRTRALSRRQLEREGLQVDAAAEVVEREVASPTDANADKWGGATQKGVVFNGADAAGKPAKRTMWVDPGFGSGPLAGHPVDQLLLRKGVAALGDERAFGLVRDAVLSPTRLRAWDAFVDGAFSSGIVNQDGLGAIQGQTSTAGIVPFNVARALLDRGARLSPVVFVDDRLLVGKKALRHARAGDELSQEQWRQLPTDSTMATWYWDVEESRIMAVYSADESRSVQLAIAETGEMRSAYLAKDSEIEQKIRSGRWIALK